MSDTSKCAACDNPARAPKQRYCQKHHAEACKRYYQKQKQLRTTAKAFLTEHKLDTTE